VGIIPLGTIVDTLTGVVLPMFRLPGLPLILPAALALTVFLPSAGQAQAAGGDVIQARDGVYTQLQARRGQVIYEAACAACHGTREFSGTSFMRRWSNLPIGSLFQHVQSTMPDMAPGILSNRQTSDIMAYVLSLNGFPAGSAELPATTEALGRVRMDRPGEG